MPATVPLEDVEPMIDAGVAVGQRGGVADDGEEEAFRRGMLQECERLRAAQYRQWEREVTDEALNEPMRPEGLLLVVRGGVRRHTGHQGTTQTIMFRIQPGETVDLRIAAPEREVHQRHQGREGAEETEG